MSEKIHYATRDIHGGLDWRTISRVMNSDNMKLSPSRARGLFMRMMEKFAYETLRNVKGKASKEESLNLAKNPAFQQSIGSILREAYKHETFNEVVRGENKCKTNRKAF